MTNSNVSIKSRLKLFDSVISPCILFGLGALPIHQHFQDQVDITQRKMLRKIIGWRRVPDEPWDITMRRMKLRMSSALDQWYIKPWSMRINLSRWSHACRVKAVEPERWVSLACKWKPDSTFDLWHDCVPYRSVGRPVLKWDDSLASFSKSIFGCKWHDNDRNARWCYCNEYYLQNCK